MYKKMPRSREVKFHAFEPQKKLKVTFSCSDASDKCGISHDLIRSSELDFSSNVVEKNASVFPPLDKAILACGHQFHGTSLVYHFMANSLSCPVCRHGYTHTKMNAAGMMKNRVINAIQFTINTNDIRERNLEAELTNRFCMTQINCEAALHQLEEEGLQNNSMIPLNLSLCNFEMRAIFKSCGGHMVALEMGKLCITGFSVLDATNVCFEFQMIANFNIRRRPNENFHLQTAQFYLAAEHGVFGTIVLEKSETYKLLKEQKYKQIQDIDEQVFNGVIIQDQIAGNDVVS